LNEASSPLLGQEDANPSLVEASLTEMTLDVLPPLPADSFSSSPLSLINGDEGSPSSPPEHRAPFIAQQPETDSEVRRNVSAPHVKAPPSDYADQGRSGIRESRSSLALQVAERPAATKNSSTDVYDSIESRTEFKVEVQTQSFESPMPIAQKITAPVKSEQRQKKSRSRKRRSVSEVSSSSPAARATSPSPMVPLSPIQSESVMFVSGSSSTTNHNGQSATHTRSHNAYTTTNSRSHNVHISNTHHHHHYHRYHRPRRWSVTKFIHVPVFRHPYWHYFPWHPYGWWDWRDRGS
ncbi:hypothetical protein V5O48_018861, partial [Marasmius crinis-equi]